MLYQTMLIGYFVSRFLFTDVLDYCSLIHTCLLYTSFHKQNVLEFMFPSRSASCLQIPDALMYHASILRDPDE